jgi:hypothetical protein
MYAAPRLPALIMHTMHRTCPRITQMARASEPGYDYVTQLISTDVPWAHHPHPHARVLGRNEAMPVMPLLPSPAHAAAPGTPGEIEPPIFQGFGLPYYIPDPLDVVWSGAPSPSPSW